MLWDSHQLVAVIRCGSSLSPLAPSSCDKQNFGRFQDEKLQTLDLGRSMGIIPFIVQGIDLFTLKWFSK